MNAVLLENVIRLGTGKAVHSLICLGREVEDNWGVPSPTVAAQVPEAFYSSVSN